MRDVQKWGVDRIYDHEITILAWDMGAGKSVTALTAMDDLLEDGVVRRVLIVAPLLVAAATFPDEFDEWKHLNHIDWTLLRAEDSDDDVLAAYKDALSVAKMIGIPSTSEAAAWANDKRSRAKADGISDQEKLSRIRKEAYEKAKKMGLDTLDSSSWANRQKTKAKEWKRRRLANDRAEVHIINKEGLVWLWDHFERGKKWPYDMIIVDEASMFKNGRKRTKLKQLSQFGVAAKARKYAKRVVLMTGTPAPKGLINMWGLAYIADLGERLGTSRTAFERRWFDSDYMGWNLEPKVNAHKQITERMSDIMFTLRPEDYPQLPPMLTKVINVELPKKVLAEYRKFEKTLISELYDVEAVNNGVLAGKLLQFANGSMYDENGHDVWIHDEKLAALEEVIEEANGEPVLVAYSYKFDLARIRRRFKKAVVFGEGDVRKTKADWNAGKIDLMLAHPQSVGHGQNIQFGGNIMTWYGLTPDLELYQQFNKRLHRPGQQRKVTNVHIIAKDTYDEDILPLLRDRGQTQDSIMRAFRISLINRKSK